MNTTLLEKAENGTLADGYYYVKLLNENPPKDHVRAYKDWVSYKDGAWDMRLIEHMVVIDIERAGADLCQRHF